MNPECVKDKDGLREKTPFSKVILWTVVAVAAFVTVVVLVFRAFQPAEIVGGPPSGAGDGGLLPVPAGTGMHDASGNPVAIYTWSDTLLIVFGMLGIFALMGWMLWAFFKHDER